MGRVAANTSPAAGGAASSQQSLAEDSVGVWEIDLVDHTLRPCHRTRLLCGLPPDHTLALGQVRHRLDPRGARTFDAAIATLSAGGAVRHIVRVRLDDRTSRCLLLQGAAVQESYGPPTRALGTATDVTTVRGRLHTRLAARSRVLAQATAALAAEADRSTALLTDLTQARKLEALGALASGMAHDLNNTLTAIVNSYWLIDRRSDDPRIHRVTAQGARAADRAGHLVRRLLDFARKEQPADIAVDPAGLLAAAEPSLRQAAGPRITVKVAVQPGTAAVLTDPRLLESALINLVVNARDAMPHGGTLTVTVGNEAGEPADNATAPTGLVAFAVRDSGCGMSPDVLARATDPFFTTKAAGAGTGLGLAMVRSLAEQSGGTLRFASRPGAGTVVTLALPAAGVPQPDMAAAPAAADAAVRDDGTILLVDDDGELRGVMAECLEDLGWTVIEAGNGVDALAAVAAADRLDLVIADVAMPSMDGLTLSLRLRTTRPGLPVLFMSGDADMAELAPGEMLLPKPFTTAGLTDAIARKLGRPPASTAPLSGNAAFNETAPIDAPRRDALLERLRDPRLRAALQAWLAAGTSDRLPPPEAVDPAAFDATDHAALIAVDPTADPVEFRFVRAGRSLEARLGRSLAGERLQAFADEALGSLPGAAVRCARTLQPGYERARFDLGDGIPSGLERLLLPLSADGAGVTHLLSVAIFEPELEPLHHARPRSAHL